MTKHIDGKLYVRNDFRYEVVIDLPGQEPFRKYFDKRKEAQRFIRHHVEMRVHLQWLPACY